MPSLLNGRYERRQPIGVGGFGVVEQYEDKLTGNLVAIKSILAKHVNAESLRLLREIDIMLQLSNRHPRVVSVFDVFCTPATPREGAATSTPEEEDDRTPGGTPPPEGGTHQQGHPPPTVNEHSDFNVHIVMPLMRGDLHRYTREGLPLFPHKDEFEQAVAVVFAFQLVFGLDFIHKCGIVHRDLKPENILISLDMASPYESTALIADFGLARDVRSTETFYVCTRHYRPPEVITNSAALSLSAIDIWSVGCILFELVTGKFLVRLPTSLNEAGQWEPVRASMQLEAMLGIIGTPTAEDVEAYVDAKKHANIRSYLLKSQPRPSRVADLIRKYWRLAGIPIEEQNLWIDLISSCVKFFPEQRPPAEQLCCHPLFQRYNVFYGQNIEQYVTKEYEPIQTSSSRSANKASILRLIDELGKEARKTHPATPPPLAQQEQEQEQPVVVEEQPEQPIVAVEDDEGDAEPPSAESRVVTSSLQMQRAPNAAIPAAVTDADLRDRFASCYDISSSAEVQSVMNEVLAELQSTVAQGNAERSEQLRHLLSFLVALVPQHSRAGDTTEDYAAL